MSLIFTEISGADFNKLYKGTKFYKFLNTTLVHYNFPYNVGLNTDYIPFNPFDICSQGGLYFCEESKCHLYWTDYGKKVSLVVIPDDARVYIEKDKFKADKFILTEIIDFCDMCDKFWFNIAQNDGKALKYIKNLSNTLTDEIYRIAVQKDGKSLKYVKNQTEEICKLAIQQDSRSLVYVKEQSDEICKLAVSKNGYTLSIVENQTEDICCLAVQQSGMALKYVKNQTKKICDLAVSQNVCASYFVKI